MPQVRIFRYPTRKTAVFVTGKERTYNMPIQNSKIKVYKGANIPLDFNIFDADGKPLNYDGTNKHLELKVYDSYSNRIAFTKRLEEVQETSVTQEDKAGVLMPSVRSNNYKKSIFRTVIEVTDTIDLYEGTQYRWVVMEQDALNNTGYFYSGLGHVVEGEMEITGNAAPQVEPTSILSPSTEWTMYDRASVMDSAIVGDQDNITRLGWKLFVSEVISGDAHLNVVDGLHTIALYAEDFTGVVQVQACIESEIPDSMLHHRWFNIPIHCGEVSMNFIKHNGIEPLNFAGNFLWLRVVVYQQVRPNIDHGKLSRILIRR